MCASQAGWVSYQEPSGCSRIPASSDAGRVSDVRVVMQQRFRWIMIGMLAGTLLFGCVRLGVGLIIGNLYGEDHVCHQVWDHAANPSDIPICNDS